MRENIRFSFRRPDLSKCPVRRSHVLSHAGICICETLLDAFFNQVKAPAMFYVTLVVSFLLQHSLKPPSGISPRLYVFILACCPNMLHNSMAVGDLADNYINSHISLLRADLLRTTAEFDQILEKDLNNRVETWPDIPYNFLNDAATLLRQAGSEGIDSFQYAVQETPNTCEKGVSEIA